MPAGPAWYCLLQPFDDYRLALCGVAPWDYSAGLRAFELRGGAAATERQLPFRALSALPPSTQQAACP